MQRLTDLRAAVNLGPIVLIAKEIRAIEGVQRGVQEHARYLQVSHFPEAPVGGQYVASEDAEAARTHLLAQQVIFGVERALVEAAKLDEPVPGQTS